MAEHDREAGVAAMAVVTDKPLDMNEAIRFVADERAGGISVFAGVTRAVTEGRQTVALTYEAYQSMAESTLMEIAAEVLDRYPVCRVFVSHRTGTVAGKEPSVIVAVSAPHRPEAFDGCRYVIDQLKERAPIWKKEVFSDGTAEWVGP